MFNKIKIKLMLMMLLILLLPVAVYSQEEIDLDLLSAREEFKWGVKAYHRGLFNEAVRAFERALAHKPENSEMQKWLGQAWYRSGFTDAAIQMWESIQAAGQADSLLLNRLEILKQQTGVTAESGDSGRFLPAMELDGINEDYTIFKRPASVFPDVEGGFFITSYGSNHILRFNSNGALSDRLVGGIEGFNHPFDIKIAENGYLYITEFNGDRITRCLPTGGDITRFGESGRGDGELLGPQYLAIDEKNFIYVTDSGNRRVVKFDRDGKFILSFGQKNYNFKGFSQPTGIECFDNRVYVADADQGEFHVFDYSGNFIETISTEGIVSPEGLSRLNDNNLLVADSGRVMALDIERNTSRLVSDLDGKGKYITQAVIDANGNLLTADFDLSRITVLTELSNMYAGLFIEVDRLDSNNYPEIIADIRVLDREGNPFVGLASNNFVVTENGYSVSDAELIYTGNKSDKLNVSVLLDSSAGMIDFHPDMIKAVESLMRSAGSGSELTLVSAGENPVTEAKLSEGERTFMASASDPGIFSDFSSLDLGIRHSISELVTDRGRRAVICVTDGAAAESAFQNYHPVEIADYLKNNGIYFYCVDVSNETAISEELKFICEETGGDQLFLYQPEGLSNLFNEILDKPDGSYTLRFDSSGNYLGQDDFIPIEIEAFLYNRSGREASGYFKPGKS